MHLLSNWMRYTRKFWPQGLLVVAILYFAFPSFMDSLDLPAFDPQNKCPPGAPRPDGKADPANKERPNSGEVFIIRLTNSGQFVDRCELTDALDELIGNRKLNYGPRWKEGTQELPRLTLLYIHGWKHHAKSEDLDNFRKLIGELNLAHKEKKQILGVYVAWNASWQLGWLNNLSFWSKESIADRIAQSSALTKIISSLGAMRRTETAPRDQLIAIGHSFGARMLFAATGQSLIYEAERAHPGKPGGTYSTVHGAADAIVLLNPAFEASMYSILDGVHRTDENFPPEQAPLLLSISSTADSATGMFFPIGQWLGGAQTDIERTTLGNYKKFTTHTLARNSECVGRDSNLSDEFFTDGLCLKRSNRDKGWSQPGNPFLVASTTPDVISGHNDIWNDNFRGWLRQFIEALAAKRARYPGENSTVDRRPRGIVQ